MTKEEYLKHLVNENGVIAALAIDQRGALRKMIGKYQDVPASDEQLKAFKAMIAEELTPFASAILLDAEYGVSASKKRDENCGLLLAYEKTGYDANKVGRLPDILDVWSVRRLKEAGADACKFLLYYDVDEDRAINEQKEAFIERIGSECVAEDLPFFLEIVTYDADNADATGAEYAKVKPHKVIDMMKIFSEARFGIDCLKVEVPVNMNCVAGFGDESVYTVEEAKQYFAEQSQATDLPFIFLSAGVSPDLFRKTLHFAKDAGSSFNGVLCGRATWAGAVEPFITEGEAAARKWCQTTGRDNIEQLNKVLAETASTIK